MAIAVRKLGRALRHRNYRLFFAGQGLSLIGTWITRLATSWMVYRLTGSALLLGVVAFANQAPSAALAPLAGVLVDRWDRHRVIVVTQALAMLQSTALAVLALTGVMQVVHLIALGMVQGIINAFDMPARQSFLIEMIDDRADLSNAIALNSSMVNGAKLVGPSIAGVLIALVGEGWCFAIDAVSYLAVIGSLLAMRVTPRPLPAVQTSMWHQLYEGVCYVVRQPLIRAVLLLLAVSALFGQPYTVLMPSLVSSVLGGGPDMLGLLMGATGLGALAGALYLASRSTVLGLGTVIARVSLGFGLGLIALSFAPNAWLAAPLMFVTGLCMMVQMAATNTIIQTVVDEDKRGRVMSFYAVAFFGASPLGALVEGSIASAIGVSHTLLAGGAICLIGALVFRKALPGLRRETRPIYQRLGILPREPK